MKNRVLLLLLFISPAFYSQIDVYFQSDKSILNPDQIEKLDEFVSSIDFERRFEIQLKGHADFESSESYNLKLSEERNMSVMNYLLENGVDQMDVISLKYGELFPVSEDDSREGRQLNRRVEVFLNYLEMPKVKNTIDELYSQMELPFQTFCIKNNISNLIKCKGGTQIYVPKNSFDIDPNYRGCVSVKITEALKKSEMFLADLNTTSNGDILESAGMFKIEAFVDGEEVTLKEGVNLSIAVPTDTELIDPYLFDGHQTENGINWDQSGSVFYSSYLGGINDYLWLTNATWSEDRCRLFFCRIFRALNIRDSKPRINSSITSAGNVLLDPMFDGYDIQNENDLFEAFNEITGDRYNVDSVDEFLLAQRKEKMRVVEEDFTNIEFDDLSYYVFQLSSFGWKNIDCFSNYRENEKVDFVISVEPSENTDVKIIFTKIKSILTPTPSYDSYAIFGVPKGLKANIVAIKYDNNKVYLCIKEIKVEKKAYDIQFEEVDLETLKIELTKLDNRDALFSQE